MANETRIVTKDAKDLVAGDRQVGYGTVIVAVELMNGDILVAYDSNTRVTYRPGQTASIEVAA